MAQGIILMIDPGEVHVGFAEFEKKGSKFECVAAGETRPFTMIHTLESDNRIQKVVMEEFRLYPWRMKEQGFSQLKTVELIGVIRYICSRRAIELVEQPASVKNPTEGILKAKGVLLKSRGAGPHAKDAEIHGWYYFRTQLVGKGEK